MVKINPNIEKAYATDIIEPNSKSKEENKVTFIKQISAESTGLGPQTADTVIMSVMLHHLSDETRKNLINHVFNILRPGGKLLVFEDSFMDKETEAHLKNQLDEDFSSLSKQEKMDFLTFLDWWGNRLMKDNAEIPLPYTFLSFENWLRLFKSVGFVEEKSTYIGFDNIDTHMMMPKAEFLQTRPVK